MNNSNLNRKAVIWFIGVMVVLAAIGYWAYIDFDQAEPIPESKLRLNDILLLDQTQVSSFDPLDAFHEGHIQIVKQVYETLTDIDEDGQCIPLLADKWETDDNRLWRFYLRENVYFSQSAAFGSDSERLLDAEDVVYSFERLLSPKSKSLGIAYFSNIIGFEDFRNGKESTLRGLRAVSAHVVEFELASPDSKFHCVVSLPFASVVKQDVVNYYGDAFNLNPVGTGPFILTEYDPDQKVVLVRNPDFHRDPEGTLTHGVQEVDLRLTRDENSAFAAFASGSSDFLTLDFPGLTRLRKEELPFDVEIVSRPTAKLQFYLFNLKTITDSAERRDIVSAINREKLQKLLGESGTIAKSIFPEAIFPELASAQSQLENMGMRESPITPSKHSEPLRLICFNDTLSRAVASIISDDLRTLGYEVKVEAATFPVLVERLTRNEYDLIQIYWGPMYAEAAHYLGPFLSSQFPPQGNNFNQYSNPLFDAIIESAKASGIKDAQIEMFLEAQDILLQDMPLVPIYFENLVRSSNKKFNMPTHPLLYRRYNLARPR